MPESIIFVPSDSAAGPWLTICAAYCARKGYTVVAVASKWEDVVRLVKDDGIDVVVVGRREHLPADRPWRIETVTEQIPHDPPERRRPTRR